jgi:hypothetical protein
MYINKPPTKTIKPPNNHDARASTRAAQSTSIRRLSSRQSDKRDDPAAAGICAAGADLLALAGGFIGRG